MYFSGKITNSFFVFLNRFSEFDDARLFGMTELETDFIKDPNSWMRARYVEDFLRNIRSVYQAQFIDKDLIITVGHSFHELNSWGGLDKFLKMFSSSRDIYKKLDVIFSYFLSDFQIRESRETEDILSFKTNFPSGRYPAAADYLKAVLEKFPVFLGEDMTEAFWEGRELKICYPLEKTMPLPLKGLEKKPAPPIDKALLLKKLSLCEQNVLSLKEADPAAAAAALKLLSEAKDILA